MEVWIEAKELLAAAKFCECKDNKGTRELLRCAHVEATENGYVIAATDSYKLLEFTHEYKIRESNDIFSCNIDIDTIKSSVKTTDELIRVEYDEQTCNVAMDVYGKRGAYRATVSAHANEGRYPNYKALLNENASEDNCGHEVRLNPTYLAEVCKDIELAYGKETPIDIDIRDAMKPVYFSAVGKTKRDADNEPYKPVAYCKALIMPIRK